MDNNVGYYCFVAMLLVFIVGPCSYFAHQDSPSIAINPERVQLELVSQHELNHYSVQYKTEDNILVPVDLGRMAEIKIDVPEGEQIWGLLNRAQSPNGKKVVYRGGGVIHLHSAKEINGAGWDHGKYGRGQTVVIEAN